MEEIAARFRELWKALTEKDGQLRHPAETSMLIDRVRDALDRRTGALGEGTTFVAGTFAIEATVHEGLMAVQRLRHRDLGTFYAMKTLAPQHADDPTLCSMLQREARVLLELDHPRIVRGHVPLRLGDGRPALILDWAETTLGRVIEDLAPTIAEVRAAMVALMQGVAAIGQAGYVHGDLAPSNLLMTGRDYAALKIADFGACVAIGESQAEHGVRLAGRPLFASPEQMEGNPLDVRADLYSCGAILSFMLDACADMGEERERMAELAAWMRMPAPNERPTDAAAVLKVLGVPVAPRR